MRIKLSFASFLLIANLFLSIFVSAQTTFQRTFGGTAGFSGAIGYAVKQTSDGGYIMTGSTNCFGAGSNDVYLVKTNSDATVFWTKTFGGTGDDYGYAVQETADGGYAIAGHTYSFGAGVSDIYLIKTTSDGTMSWTKTYGGSATEYGYSMQQTADGGFVILGMTATPFTAGASGGADFYLIKTASDGVAQWTKTYGRSLQDWGYSVQQTADGGYIMTGAVSFSGVPYDVYLIKATSDGTLSWTKTYGGTGQDVGYEVQQTADGGYAIAGIKWKTTGSDIDLYLIKTNSVGTLSWTKTYANGGGDEECRSMQQTVDGGFILAGNTWTASGDAYIVKTTSDGTFAWSKSFGTTEIGNAYCVRQTSDGGYAIAGSSVNTSTFRTGMYLIKTDSDGSSGCGETTPAAPTVSNGGTTSSGGTAGSGGVSGTGGVTSTPASVLLDACTGLPLPIELLDFNTTAENNEKVKCDWSTAMEMNSHFFSLERSQDAYTFSTIEHVPSAAPSGYSNIPLYYSRYDLNPYVGVSYYRLKGVDYNGQYKYSPIRSVYIGATEIITIYPNPSFDGHIQYTVGSEKGEEIIVQLLDVLGREVINQKEILEKGINTKQLNATSLNSGTYLIRITNGTKEKVQKQFLIR